MNCRCGKPVPQYLLDLDRALGPSLVRPECPACLREWAEMVGLDRGVIRRAGLWPHQLSFDFDP